MSTLWKKPKPATDENLIPLINIVFLLLIFFMVAGQMREQTAAGLSLPISNAGNKAETVEHRLEMNAELQTFFNGQPIAQEQLVQQLTQLPNKAQLTVFLHRHLTAQQVQPVLSLLREQQITRINLISESEG